MTAADHLVRMTDGMTFEQAGATPMAGLVALQAMRDIADVQPGDRVLVNGASGGIGTFTVQVAKAMGAEVTGVCRTDNLERVQAIGADHLIDYTREDFTQLGEQWDVILDIPDDKPLSARRRVLSEHGTLIPNSGAGNKWIASAGRIAGARLLSPFVSQSLHPFLSTYQRDDLLALRKMIAAGDVTPVIDRTATLAEGPDAIDYIGRGHARGKVVITP